MYIHRIHTCFIHHSLDHLLPWMYSSYKDSFICVFSISSTSLQGVMMMMIRLSFMYGHLLDFISFHLSFLYILIHTYTISGPWCRQVTTFESTRIQVWSVHSLSYILLVGQTPLKPLEAFGSFCPVLWRVVRMAMCLWFLNKAICKCVAHLVYLSAKRVECWGASNVLMLVMCTHERTWFDRHRIATIKCRIFAFMKWKWAGIVVLTVESVVQLACCHLSYYPATASITGCCYISASGKCLIGKRSLWCMECVCHDMVWHQSSHMVVVKKSLLLKWYFICVLLYMS